MASLFESIATICFTQGLDKTYWIAYSGGLDSHVLLHLFAEFRQQHPIHLRAIHINHGLSANAVRWQKHCAEVCGNLQIDFLAKTIEVKSLAGKSLEEVARDLRYAVFSELLSATDFLLTAHQQDDQAETLLLQLLRGAGPKGLAAMPKIKVFAQGFHARPLLDFTRADLKKYAEQKNLSWIDDESNSNTHFTRNFLRHEILPLLKKRWPSVTKTLARVAEHCAEASTLLENNAVQDLMLLKEVLPYTLSSKKLVLFDTARQREILRAWFREQHFPVPSAVKMQQIQHDFLQAAEDKKPYMRWGKVELRRYQDKLYVMPCLQPHDSKQVYQWDLTKPLNLPGIGILHATLNQEKKLELNGKNITVRFRQGGEHCHLPGRDFHHELKKLFQQWGVPPWLRGRVPLVFVDEVLVAVVGYFIDETRIGDLSLKI